MASNTSEMIVRSSPDGGEDDEEAATILLANTKHKMKYIEDTHTATDGIVDKTGDCATAYEEKSKYSKLLRTKLNSHDSFTGSSILQSDEQPSFKHGEVGFNEIFGDVTCKYTPPDNYHEETLQSEFLSTGFTETGTITTDRNVVQQDPNSESDDWSDWDDVNDQTVVEKSASDTLLFPNISESAKASKSQDSYDFVPTSTSSSTVSGCVEPINSLSNNWSPKANMYKQSKEKYCHALQTNQSLGEEYDINCIKIKKKQDEELNLFADIAPNFTHETFNLESMLEEANTKCELQTKVAKNEGQQSTLSNPLYSSITSERSSVSDMLADLPVEEGGWGDEIDIDSEIAL